MQPWVHWFEIPVADMARAKKFYEGVFGFELADLEPAPGLRMALFPGSEKMEGGGSLIHYEGFYTPGATGPLVHFNGDPDLGPLLGRVEALGGKVVIAKRQISAERGFMGVFMDTEGNRIALHSRA